MNILLVDDHPFTTDGYKTVMLKSFAENVTNIAIAASCKAAYDAVAAARDSFTLAVIDQNLPAYDEKKLRNGTDIALLLRKTMPSCKIIMITAHTEILVLYDIFKRVNPEGFVTKSELTPENLGNAAKAITGGDTYISTTVSNSITEVWKKELMVDDTNRQILFFMAKGYKAMELANLVFLSDSSIQKRIASMKKAFGVIDNSSLVKEAIQQGFL
ncbi:response regulator [Flavobacterium sp. RHBU_24]|uniref:response regulator n=1 Tax=Flavobacterium sp. RHBU_24 TaxID=3391185 RepID=UPI003985067B